MKKTEEKMKNEFFSALDELEEKRGISKAYMLEKVEQALVNAFKREEGASNVRVHIDENKGEVKVFKQLEVVETVEDEKTQITLADAKRINRRSVLGGTLEIEVKTKNFGRISAQTAKQVIIQGIREAERGMMIKEYESKREDIITAQVERIDEVTGNVVLNTGTGYATLLKKEQLVGDTFEVGDHVKVFIMEVKSSAESRGPLVTLSRVHQNFVKRLFELEVPEIPDGLVKIMGITREAGMRTKIAVYSTEPGVDPVGACIGARGIRINAIMKELHGEKIDIIKYSEDPAEYVREALSPATVKEVQLSDDRTCKVFVSPDQLSLAIGREGQNARLAARLTGYKIDIKTE